MRVRLLNSSKKDSEFSSLTPELQLIHYSTINSACRIHWRFHFLISLQPSRAECEMFSFLSGWDMKLVDIRADKYSDAVKMWWSEGDLPAPHRSNRELHRNEVEHIFLSWDLRKWCHIRSFSPFSINSNLRMQLTNSWEEARDDKLQPEPVQKLMVNSTIFEYGNWSASSACVHI